MSKLYRKYISFLYIKNFLVIFFALEFFHVSIDLISNMKNLPSSANLQLLYAYYVALMGVNFILPLSLVFAMISSKISLMRSNELVSLYASGISKTKVIMPLFISAMLITSALVFANCTSFAYANEYQINILKHNRISTNAKKLFVRYDDKYIYIGLLDPVKKQAQDVKIFETKDGELKSIISAEELNFQNDSWFTKKASKLVMPKLKILGADGFKRLSLSEVSLLDGFKPNIIDSIADAKISLSVLDAYEAIVFLSSQDADSTAMRSIFYSLTFFPFFAPFMVAILFFFMPPTARFFNTALLSSLLIFVSLCTWGCIYALSKFAETKVILPELAIIAPIILLAIIAGIRLYKNR